MTYHTVRMSRMNLLEEIHTSYCTGLFYMHNCVTKRLVKLVRTPYSHSTSVDDNIPFGGGFHTPNTNIGEMSRKNIE